MVVVIISTTRSHCSSRPRKLRWSAASDVAPGRLGSRHFRAAGDFTAARKHRLLTSVGVHHRRSFSAIKNGVGVSDNARKGVALFGDKPPFGWGIRIVSERVLFASIFMRFRHFDFQTAIWGSRFAEWHPQSRHRGTPCCRWLGRRRIRDPARQGANDHDEVSWSSDFISPVWVDS